MKIATIAALILFPLLSHADVLVRSTSVSMGFDETLAAISKATEADPKPFLQRPAKQGLEKSVFGGGLSRLQYDRLLKALKENPNKAKTVSGQVVVSEVALLFLEHPAGLRIGKEGDERLLMSLKFTEKPRLSVHEPFFPKQQPVTGAGAQVTVGSVSTSWLFENDTWSWFHYRNHQGTEYLVLVSIADKLEQVTDGKTPEAPQPRN